MSARELLADTVLVLHFGVVLFNIGVLAVVLVAYGRGWEVTRLKALRQWHLAIVWFIAAEAAFGYACPLTILEDFLREPSAASSGFLQRWISRIIFWDLPTWAFTMAYLAFALTVTATYALMPPRSRPLC